MSTEAASAESTAPAELPTAPAEAPTPAEAPAPAEPPASAASTSQRVSVHRTVVLAVPDWPAVAAGIAHGLSTAAPAAVLRAGRIISCNAPARASGVETGLNKRAAQLRCPELTVIPWDPEVDHRVFAAGIGVLEDLVARFTLLSPGVVSIPALSLRRTHASEESAVEELLTGLTDSTGWEFFPGIADTAFAALLASRTATRVPPGRTAAFLAPLPISSLTAVDAHAYAELVPLLGRLGLTALGRFAQLAEADVHARFGTLGRRAHRLARGLPDRIPADHVRAREFRVHSPLDPPSGRSDVLSFHARTLGAELLGTVRAAGLVCTQVDIELTATTGETCRRTWRLEDMDESMIADRLRWQAEGWLAAGGAGTGADGRGGPRTRGARPDRRARTARPDRTARAVPENGEDPGPDPTLVSGEDGICAIGLAAAELLSPLGTQQSLFDQHPGRIAHTLERLQGLFGPDAVLVPGLQGGRDPAETNLWTPWQQRPRPERDPEAPWPGAVPAPRPTLVEHTPVDLLDERGATIVARPAGLDNVPALLRIPGTGTVRVVDHSSAWPVEAGWWDRSTAQYRVRLQVVAEDGAAYLLSKESGRWYLTGRYA
ncbi:DNA polymerase Y family protein [Brevibacterium sp. NPDC049920]|uniref:DNA polymerase Y family protein n=1 Tax=Brevibacterium pityocampae TaxID=506594 RepID=A0ABP8JDJ3_9MICO